MVQFLPVSAAGLSLQSILWVIIDPILVTFGDMEHLLKPEPSHFKYLLTEGEFSFPLNPESVQLHFSNSFKWNPIMVNPVTKCNFTWQPIPLAYS